MAGHWKTYPRTCRKCGIPKDKDSFHPMRGKRAIHGYRYSLCIQCSRANYATRRKVWNANNVERVQASRRRIQFKKNYGITIEDYNSILSMQGCVCAICGGSRSKSDKWKNLAVDHSHKTGQVRGLLCMECNAGLGSFLDSPDLLEKAAAYIKASKSVSRV